MSELTADEDEEGDEEGISVEDVQPAVLSLIEALAAIRKLDRYLRSSDDNQEVLHSLTTNQKHVLNKSCHKNKAKKVTDFLARK